MTEGINCPKCGVPHDGVTDRGGWATCRACAHLWRLQRNIGSSSEIKLDTLERFDTAPAQEPDARAREGTEKRWGVSNEYAPETGVQRGANPLTTKVDSPGSGTPEAEEVEVDVGDFARRDSTGAIELDLFDKLEAEIGAARQNQETVDVRDFGAADAGASAATGAPPPSPEDGNVTSFEAAAGPELRPGERLIHCPDCGRGFASKEAPDDRYNCPHCDAHFSFRSGTSGKHKAVSVDDESDGRSPSDIFEDRLIGRTFNGYHIERKLGEGGMGAVYLARQLSLDRHVAIKVLPSELRRNRKFIKRFEREAKILAQINHPNIVHIYDFGEDAQVGVYYMIIEYVDGTDLGELLREQGEVDQIQALDIIKQAALGLEMACEKGVIHRDIKPDNLMITKAGNWKVSDFGLAKADTANSEVTNSGIRVGTPAFMSPEQCDGIALDFRSDMYSLGCTIYLALTGRLPFHADSPFSIMLKHKTEEPPSLRGIRPELHEEMERLVLTMLAKRPEDRYASLRDLVHATEEAARAIAGTDSVLRGERGGTPSSTRMPVVEAATQDESSDEWLPTPASVAMLEQQSGRRVDSSTTYQPGTDHRRRAGEDVDPQPDYGHGNQPVSTDIRLAAAQGAAERGDYHDAVRGFEDLLREHPDDPEVREQLEGALERKRSAEFRQYESEAKQLTQRKRWKTAARSWGAAADLASNERDRRRCQRQADEAKRYARRRRLRRVVIGFVLLLALIVVGTWRGTPLVHNWLADRELERISAISADAERAVALQDFLDRLGQVPWWYRDSYQFLRLPADYDIAAAERARDLLARIAEPQPPIEPDEDATEERPEEAANDLGDEGFVP